MNLKNFNLLTIEQLVFPKYNSSYLTTLALRELQSAYNSADLCVDIVKDNAEIKDYELLVGKTNRTVTAINEKIADVKSYYIGFSGNKLMIVGGSPKAINTAINILTSKIKNREYIIDEEISGQYSEVAATVGEYNEIITDDFEGTEVSDLWYNFAGKESNMNNDGTKKTIVTLDGKNLSWVENGKLYQKATFDSITKEGYKTIYNVSRPKISTQTAFWYRFGYTEASMKLTSGNGVGGAYWLHGRNAGLGSRYCEYDIFETHGKSTHLARGALAWNVVENPTGIGAPVRNECSLYLDTPNNTGDEYRYFGTITLENGESFADEFHTFGMEWDEEYYNFTIDGEIVKSIKYTDMPEFFPTKLRFTKDEMIEVLREPVHAIFDVYIGVQSWAYMGDGCSDTAENNTDYENTQEVEYFTVYQKSGQLNGKTFDEVKQKMK